MSLSDLILALDLTREFFVKVEALPPGVQLAVATLVYKSLNHKEEVVPPVPLPTDPTPGPLADDDIPPPVSDISLLLMEALDTKGNETSRELSVRTHLSDSTTRRHLCTLATRGLVTVSRRIIGKDRGRPAVVYSLSKKGEAYPR